MLQCRMWGGDFPIGNAGGGEGREGRWGGFPFVSAGVWWYVTCILCSRGIFLLGMQEGERGEGGATSLPAHLTHSPSLPGMIMLILIIMFPMVQSCELGISKNPPIP